MFVKIFFLFRIVNIFFGCNWDWQFFELLFVKGFFLFMIVNVFWKLFLWAARIQ